MRNKHCKAHMNIDMYTCRYMCVYTDKHMCKIELDVNVHILSFLVSLISLLSSLSLLLLSVFVRVVCSPPSFSSASHLAVVGGVVSRPFLLLLSVVLVLSALFTPPVELFADGGG